LALRSVLESSWTRSSFDRSSSQHSSFCLTEHAAVIGSNDHLPWPSRSARIEPAPSRPSASIMGPEQPTDADAEDVLAFCIFQQVSKSIRLRHGHAIHRRCRQQHRMQMSLGAIDRALSRWLARSDQELLPRRSASSSSSPDQTGRIRLSNHLLNVIVSNSDQRTSRPSPSHRHS
jgi:hypothetical protein